MKKIAVILSGCGVFDGSEIIESVLTLKAIETEGATYQCFAPNIEQHHVINHITGEEMKEKRNVLIEASRICRGNIQDVATLDVEQFDALLLPGGFGVAKNLSNFALGGDFYINPDVKKACQAFAEAQKNCGYICIAPVFIPHIYNHDVQGTIGNDINVANAFNTSGGKHIECPVNKFIHDEKNKVFSTPAYMLGKNIIEVESGINRLVKAVIEN